MRIAMAGAGAAGTAVLKLLLARRAPATWSSATSTALSTGRGGDLDANLRWIAEHTNPDGYAGDLAGAVRGADVFIGVSAPNILTGEDIAAMNDGRDRLRASQPGARGRPGRRRASTPPSWPPGAATTPTRSTTCWPSPGVFRGLLDAQSRTVTADMLLAAARALAAVVTEDELSPHYIIPSVFHPGLAQRVAAAVREVALREGGVERHEN